MNRFFGMMPSNEIEIEKEFKDINGHYITISAGPHGWTVLYADGGSSYKDEDDISENNFNKAYKVAVNNLGELTETGSNAILNDSSEC